LKKRIYSIGKAVSGSDRRPKESIGTPRVFSGGWLRYKNPAWADVIETSLG
jgi:hypothetical protein